MKFLRCNMKTERYEIEIKIKCYKNIIDVKRTIHKKG